MTGLIVDSFAGGGGASLGIERALGRAPDIAINHDAEAVAMHAANHPDAEHYCHNIWQVDPAEVVRGGRRLTRTAQIRLCGNSVCPQVAAAVVAANVPARAATSDWGLDVAGEAAE